MMNYEDGRGARSRKQEASTGSSFIKNSAPLVGRSYKVFSFSSVCSRTNRIIKQRGKLEHEKNKRLDVPCTSSATSTVTDYIMRIYHVIMPNSNA